MAMKIEIVGEERCPVCGGGEEFGNRPKVQGSDGLWAWKCYNPDCDAAYYTPETGEVEYKATEEGEAAIAEWSRQMQAYYAQGHWEGQADMRVPGATGSRFVPKEGTTPPPWPTIARVQANKIVRRTEAMRQTRKGRGRQVTPRLNKGQEG